MVPTAPESRQIVVAAIIRDSQGRCLVARRPPGKAGAGLWEFPGGKVEPGEYERDALVRELREELGITATLCTALPHWRARDPAGIHLSFWSVDAFEGEAVPREGQSIRWCAVDDLPGLAFLPADAPVVARLRLPPHYVISAASTLGEATFLAQLEDVAAHRQVLVQLREPWPLPQLEVFARTVRALCHRHGCKLVINADADRVADCADGVHLTSRRLLALNERPLPPAQLVGASCHNADELAHAARIGCDFAVLSPVLETPSHPGATPLGWSQFARLAASTALPVYALGGMLWDDLTRSRASGGHGVALRSAAFAPGPGTLRCGGGRFNQ